MASGSIKAVASKADIDALNGNLSPLVGHIVSTTSDFTSWTFSVKKNTGVGILIGFSEVWAFAYSATDLIDAQQVVHGLRNQGDRGFSFSFSSNAKTITVTTSSTVWGGATVII